MRSGREVSGGNLDYESYPVLYVDDEPANLEAFADEFEEYFTIYTALSGPEGLSLIAQEDIALVVADQRMPRMSGIEMLERVREEKPDIIRILITAYTDLEVVVEAINKGNVYQYFRKPWSHEDIRTGIMRSIEHYHSERSREILQNEKIENMRKMIRSHRLAAIGTMVSGLVHEIRNPLVSIHTFLELLVLRRNDNEFIERYTKITKREVDRIEQLLNNLLSSSKLSRPVMKPDDLNDIVEHTIGLLSLQTKVKDIEVCFDKGEHLPQVHVDRNQIIQVVQNLGMNAIQAMDRSGKLYFRTSSVEEKQGAPFILLEIRDTGEGIPEEHLEKIYDPFFSTKDEGTGLGLSISCQIINEHQGMMEVQSQTGAGSSFFLCLPVNDPKKNEEAVSVDEGIKDAKLGQR